MVSQLIFIVINSNYLSKDEVEVLVTVCELVKSCVDPDVTMTTLKVVESKNEKRVIIATNGQISISRQLLDIQFVHQGSMVFGGWKINIFDRIYTKMYV